MAALGWLLNLGFAGGAGATYTLTADAGAFTLTGNAATLKVSRLLTAGTGAFTLTGNAAGLYRGYTLTASAGSFALTGNAATLKVSRLLTAGTGAFALTGNAATLTYSGAQLWAVVSGAGTSWTAQAQLMDEFIAGSDAGDALRSWTSTGTAMGVSTTWTVQ